MDQEHRQILRNQLALIEGVKTLLAHVNSDALDDAEAKTELLLRQKDAKSKNGKLTLFVWTEFSPDYSNDLVFAFAENEEQAKRLAEVELGHRVTDWGMCRVFVYPGKPMAFCCDSGN